MSDSDGPPASTSPDGSGYRCTLMHTNLQLPAEMNHSARENNALYYLDLFVSCDGMFPERINLKANPVHCHYPKEKL